MTGTHGDQEHAGNDVVRRAPDPVLETEAATHNRTDLTGLLDTGPYPTGHSDIVALMVVEHQIYVQNLITRVNWEVRTLLDAQAEQSDRGRDSAAGVEVDIEAEIAAITEPLVRSMLFVNEAQITSPIVGTSGFRSEFESRGPWDGEGRSLRDMDLTRRLFRYPMSFLIYSEGFDALAVEAKDRV